MEEILCKIIVEYNPNKIDYWETIKLEFGVSKYEEKLFKYNIKAYAQHIFEDFEKNDSDFYCGLFCGQHNLTFMKICISGNDLGTLLIGLEASQVTLGLLDSLQEFLIFRFGLEFISSKN